MRHVVRAAALLAVLMLGLAVCARADAPDFALGGSGEDVLGELLFVDGGWFAVGTTASTDGDLASRTRTGETGWAVRIGANGRRQWDFCSAKSGMLEMTAPHLHADGSFAVVLTDETRQRGEWIVLSQTGRQLSRIAIPEAPALCPEGEAARIVRMIPGEGPGGPILTLLLAHGDGALCCAALTQSGGVLSCGTFYGDENGAVLAGGALGGVLHLGADLGALTLTRLMPGAQPQARTLSPLGGETGIGRVTDALLLGDGSLVVCGQTLTMAPRSDGYLLRLSAEGETLFSRLLAGRTQLSMLTETDTGYAVYSETDGCVLFFDEDGAPLGETAAPQGLCDLAQGSGGAMALCHLPQRSRRQAAMTLLAPQQTDTAGASPDDGTGTPQPDAQKAEEGVLTLRGGYLRCGDSDAGGVTVALVGGEGQTLWQTRIPIHTAADRLIWQSASWTREGDILLAGRYETDTGKGVVCEGAQALLSADGVLRELRVVRDRP